MKVQTYNTLFGLLTLVADAAVLTFTVLALFARWSSGAARARDAVWERVEEVGLPLAAVVGLVATLGSLYYSEIAHFVPCRLCWYQRIAMYPMPVLLGIAALRRDRGFRAYAVPLALVGAVISTYHYQLEWFPSQEGMSCTLQGPPCNVVLFRVFGYASLSAMALSGFLLIAWLTWIAGRSSKGASM
jgi:disulfide bond formation protein DsbB